MDSRLPNLAHHNPLRYRGYVYDYETELYYLQSRYYNPGSCRFVSADAYAATGQGILGNNMFAYCNNNPVNFRDDEGTRMVYTSADRGGPVGFPNSSSASSIIPPSSDVKPIILPLEFALVEESKAVQAGTVTGEFLGGEFNAYSVDNSGVNLVSLDASIWSLDIENENWGLSFFDLGNISSSIGLGVLPYASVLASVWSPSVSFSVFNKQVTIDVHVGAVGLGYKWTSSELKFTFANGFGLSVGVT